MLSRNADILTEDVYKRQFQHPGGGVYGAGRATAMRMFEHLGLDFDKVAGGSDSAAGGAVTSLGGDGGSADGDSTGATLFGAADENLLTIRTIERSGDDLVVKGQAYGTMPMVVTLRPEQALSLIHI